MMSDLQLQHAAMWRRLEDFRRKAAIDRAMRKKEVVVSGGYPCPHATCGGRLNRISWHDFKRQCSSCQVTFTNT